MKLQQLKAFVMVFDKGSFSEAALELDTSQSTLSYTIGELERELNLKLFERGRFGAVPTAAGQAIESHVRMMLRFEDAIFQEASLIRKQLEGHLRVATFRSVASQILPGIMAEFKQTYPALQVELLEMECDKKDLIHALQQGHCDVALSQVPEDDEGDSAVLHWEVMREVYVAILPVSARAQLQRVPAGSSSADSDTYQISWQQLADFAPVFHGGDKCGLWVQQRLEQLPHALPKMERVRNDFTAMELAAQGLGVSVLPHLASQPLHEGVIRATITPPLRRVIEVMLLPSGLKIPATRLLLQALKRRFPDRQVPVLPQPVKVMPR
jgi:DNA-binding transcriptional LysR family regulator